MLKNKTQNLAVSGLFLAIGLILPYFTAHAFGVAGTVLLPMHIPALLCALICAPSFSFMIAVLLPCLSCLLTAMPAAYPMLPIITVQLLVMTVITGILYNKLKLQIHLSTLLGTAAGWAAYAAMFYVLLFSNSGLKALPVTAALIQGIPGILVQVFLIPSLVLILKKYIIANHSKEKTSVINQAISIIQKDQASLILIKNDEIIHKTSGRGIAPLLNLYHNQPELLKDAVVVDKIIGKAAAMILTLGGASKAYGIVMSVEGRSFLQNHKIDAQHNLCVDVISNRDGNGICPIEKSVLGTDIPQEGLELIEAKLLKLREVAN